MKAGKDQDQPQQTGNSLPVCVFVVGVVAASVCFVLPCSLQGGVPWQQGTVQGAWRATRIHLCGLVSELELVSVQVAAHQLAHLSSLSRQETGQSYCIQDGTPASGLLPTHLHACAPALVSHTNCAAHCLTTNDDTLMQKTHTWQLVSCVACTSTISQVNA